LCQHRAAGKNAENTCAREEPVQLKPQKAGVGRQDAGEGETGVGDRMLERVRRQGRTAERSSNQVSGL